MKDDNRMGIILDFNTAQTLDYQDGPDKKARFDRIKAEAEANALAILHYLLPGGKINGSEFEAGDVTGKPGNYLKVNVGKGCVWSDFATGHKGADIFDLWKVSKRCNFTDAINQIEEYLQLKPITTQTP